MLIKLLQYARFYNHPEGYKKYLGSFSEDTAHTGFLADPDL